MHKFDVAPEIEVQWSQIRAINVAEILCHAQCRPLFQGTAFGVVPGPLDRGDREPHLGSTRPFELTHLHSASTSSWPSVVGQPPRLSCPSIAVHQCYL